MAHEKLVMYEKKHPHEIREIEEIENFQKIK